MKVRLKHERLAEELAKSRMSLNRWAQKMGLSSGHLSQLANGKRVYVRAGTRRKILEALDLEFEDLFEIEGAEDDSSNRPAPARRGGRRMLIVGGTGDGWMKKWLGDFRYAVRQFKRRPGYSLAAVLTLAVGIASATALFSLVNTVFLKPFPYAAPDSLVRVYRTSEEGRQMNFSYPDYWDFRVRNTVFSDLAATDWEPFSLSDGERPIRAGGGYATANLFRLLGIQPLKGRGFREGEDAVGAPDLVVLRESLWRSYFGADEGVVGREVLLNDRPFTIIGVMPDEAEFPYRADLWVTFKMDPLASRRTSTFLAVLGRLKPGVSLEEARQALRSIARQLGEEHPRQVGTWGAALTSLRSDQVREIEAISTALLVVMAFVLLIVCSNVVNLLLARGVARESEFAVRSALGAGRAALTRQLLAESLLVGALGGLLGLAAGRWALHLMLAAVPVRLPGWMDFGLDLRVLALVAGASLLSAVIFGLVPAWQSTRQDLIEPLRGDRSASGSSRHRRLRAVLVAGEVALACVLLVGAGLMILNVAHLSSVNPGFATEGRLTAGMDMLAHLDKPGQQRTAIFETFLERIKALPGVHTAAAVDRLALKGSTNTQSYAAEGQDVEESRNNWPPIVQVISPDYFQAMGIGLLRGRTFSRGSGAEREVIISKSMADALWPEQDPVGRRLKRGDANSQTPWKTVAGIAQDAIQTELTQTPYPILYLPYQASPLGRMTWVLRAEEGVDPLSLAQPLRRAVREVDPNQPLHDVMTMADVVEISVWEWGFFSTLFWIFAAVALGLAAIGIFGVMAYSVSERRWEMGIRMALGARRGQVVGHVFGHGLRLIAAGLLVGLPAAFAMGTLLSSVLFRVEAFEPTIYASVIAVLLVTSAAAILLPARWASHSDPARALRAE